MVGNQTLFILFVSQEASWQRLGHARVHYSYPDWHLVWVTHKGGKGPQDWSRHISLAERPWPLLYISGFYRNPDPLKRTRLRGTRHCQRLLWRHARKSCLQRRKVLSRAGDDA